MLKCYFFISSKRFPHLYYYTSRSYNMQRFSSLRSKEWLRYQYIFKREIHFSHYTPTLTNEHTHGNSVIAPFEWSTPCNSKRHLSALHPKMALQPEWLLSEEEKQEFMSYFPVIVEDLTSKSPYTDVPDVLTRFAKVLEYNTQYGKKHRGQALIAAYKAFESPERLTPANIRLANILGWAIELAQAALLIEDDMADSSKLRHGHPAWHTVEGVGMQAIYDAQMLENGFFLILKKYFSGRECYVPALELYSDITMKTRFGQSLDYMFMADGKPQFNYYTKPMFVATARYKTGYQGFLLPVTLGMQLAGKYNPELLDQVKMVLLEMGEFYQAENDILDCFGDPKVTGKEGTDIAEGKCSWLVVEALERANSQQKPILEKNYGKSQPECVMAVRNLYQDMDLLNAYSDYKENGFKRISGHIQKMSKDIPQDFFFKFLKYLYKK